MASNSSIFYVSYDLIIGFMIEYDDKVAIANCLLLTFTYELAKELALNEYTEFII